MENNFKCPECGEECFIPEYSVKFEEGKVHYYSGKQEIKCIAHNISILLIPIERKGELGFNFGKFQAMSSIEKQASLRERARIHGKKLLKQQGYDKR